MLKIAGVGVGFAQITSQSGALRLNRGGDKQIFAAAGRVAEANFAKSTAKPRVAERGINRKRMVKPRNRLARFILRCEQKSFQRKRFGISRRKREAFIQGVERFVRAAKTEFQFRDTLPCESELR